MKKGDPRGKRSGSNRNPFQSISDLEAAILGNKRKKARRSPEKSGDSLIETASAIPPLEEEIITELFNPTTRPSQESSHQNTSSIARPGEKVVSVFIILEFDCDPPELGLVLENKSAKAFVPTYFFPSGKVRDTDSTPEAGAMRESEEECGIRSDLTPHDLIHKIPITDNETGLPAFVYVYAKKVSSCLKMTPGDEQIDTARLPTEGIEELINYDLLAMHHIIAYRAYKNWKQRQQ